MTSAPTASPLDPAAATYQTIVRAGEPWFHPIAKGQTFRITDLKGNQAVDTLFYSAEDPTERYSADETIRGQNNIYLTTGSLLLSNRSRPLLTITADTCGRHDSLGGGCSAESNTVRYSPDKKYMHSCRDSFLLGLSRAPIPMGIRDLVPNINFFMNVPVTPEGQLEFADGISAAGRHVQLLALMDVLVLISNCPQLNNPCNAYNPTPVRVLTWNAA
jgi:urea carboxylase-associated protein 1